MVTTQASSMFDIPAHVPTELVRSIGLAEGPDFLAAPYAFMADLHETQPRIFYSPNQYGNAWLMTKYDDCFFALRHPEIFTTRGSTPFPRDPDNYFDFIPLEIDPPLHRKYRSMLDPMFSPQAVAKLETYIRQCRDQR